MKLKEKWEKCFKINCSPPVEVYETHINFFGSNIDISGIDRVIERKQNHLNLLKEAKFIHQKEFKKLSTK